MIARPAAAQADSVSLEAEWVRLAERAEVLRKLRTGTRS